MSKLLRSFYRFFFKNSLIRWVWMLALVLWGVRVATERGLAWHKAPLSKTVMALPASNISTFTIRRNEDDETTFTLGDTCWFVVKNNITLKIPFDSMTPYLSVFEKMESYYVNVLTAPEMELVKDKYNFDIIITEKNNANHQFSVYYTNYDAFSKEVLTYIKFPNENTLQGIKGDLLAIFGRNFDDFRDKTLLNIRQDSILYMTVKSPTDTFSLSQKNKNWFLNSKKYRLLQDSFRQYVSNLQTLRGAKFYDGDRDLLTQPKIDNQLTLYFPKDSIVLTRYKLEKNYILHSSQNNDAYFVVDTTQYIFSNHHFLLPK